MAINLNAVGAVSEPWTRQWSDDDTLLYALAVGAGPAELAFTTENTAGVAHRVLPTYAAILAGGSGRLREKLGSWDPAALVHAGQHITWLRPLPAHGSVALRSRVAGITDKGSGALIEIETTAGEVTSGDPVFRSVSTVFIRGAGGFGGSDRASASASATARASAIAGSAVAERGKPDRTLSFTLSPGQALLYRLCGDRNPLHSDPAFARRAGFDRPILHGLCTFGISGRLLLTELAGADPDRLRHLGGRFRSPVFPGDEIEVRVWHTGAGRADFETVCDGRAVIDRGEVRFDPPGQEAS